MTQIYDTILGGGVTGLVAAYELSKEGRNVLLLEKGEPGGMLRSVDKDGFSIEEFYHHVFQSDQAFFKLLDKLNLSEKLVWRFAKNGICDGSNIYKFSSPLDLLKYKPLGIADKMKFIKLMLKIKSLNDTSSLENMTAKDWVVRNSNKSVYDKFFSSLLTGKYGNMNEHISAAWFAERMRLRSSVGLKGEKLGYMKGGFAAFINKLIRTIEDNGGIIKKNTPAKKVTTVKGIVREVSFSGGKVKTNSVISTVPPSEMLRIFPPDAGYGRIRKLPYQGSVCILLGLKKCLSSYYWTNMIGSSAKFSAFIEHTNLMPRSDYNGNNIVYLASYPDYASSVWRLSDKKVFDAYFSDLMGIFPKLKNDHVIWWKIIRDKNVGLVYEKGIGSMIKGIACKSPIKNLFIGGMFNSWPERSINTSVEKGIECSEAVLNEY